MLFRSRLGATEVAATVGSVIAAIFFTLALWDGQLTWMVIAVFLFLTGKSELMMVRHEAMRERLREFYAPTESRGHGEYVDRTNFTGWTWDPHRRVWTQWQEGQAIAEHTAV